MTDAQEAQFQVDPPVVAQVVEADAGTPEGHVRQAILTRDIQLRVETLTAMVTATASEVATLQQLFEVVVVPKLDQVLAAAAALARRTELVSGVTLGNAVEQIQNKVATL